MMPGPTRKNEGQKNFSHGRRKLAKLALAGTLGGVVLAARSSHGSFAPGAAMLHDLPPGIKIAGQFMNDVSDEDLQFVNQVGAEYVSIWLHADLATYENFVRLRRKVEAAGLRLWNIGNYNVHNMEEVTLNLPGREEKIEAYKSYLRTLGKAGIYYSTLAFMGNGIWSSDRETTRGGASSRAFDLAKNPTGWWDGKLYHLPLSHGRVYSERKSGKITPTSSKP